MDFGLFKVSLPGESSAKRARKNLDNQAAMYNRWTQQYYEPGLAALWQQYQNPNSPYMQAQMNSMQAKTTRDYGNAAQQLQRNLSQRGLGQSSMMGNSLTSLWNAYGTTLANARMQQMGQQEQLRQQALAQLMGAINPGAATGLYQQNLQNAQQEQARFMNGLTGIGSLAGLWLGQPEMGTPKTSAGTGTQNTFPANQTNTPLGPPAPVLSPWRWMQPSTPYDWLLQYS